MINNHILLKYIDLSRQATANLHMHWSRFSLKLVVTCVINWQTGAKLIRHEKERDGFVTLNTSAIKNVRMCLKGSRGYDEGTTSDLRTVSYLPHVKEPVTKGHLSCRDTFSWILRCPLKTGFTVSLFTEYLYLAILRVIWSILYMRWITLDTYWHGIVLADNIDWWTLIDTCNGIVGIFVVFW